MTRAVRSRRSSRLAFAVVATVLALVGTACSDGHIDVRASPSAGWSSFGGDGANSNYSPAQVPSDLTLSWSREIGDREFSPLAITGNGDVAGTSRTANGCNFTVLDSRAGRKNTCTRLGEGSSLNTPFYDQLSQPYIGEAGMFFALTGGGAIRWRMPTIGLPLSAKSAAPGRILVTTTQGQVLLLNAQTGDMTAPEVRLRPDPDLGDPMAGVSECAGGGAQCAISAPPAVDSQRKRFFLNFFPGGAKTSQVKAMNIVEENGQEQVKSLWTADVGGGVMGPPTLSADGQTVYSFGRDGKLYALDADDGAVRWSYDLGGYGFATLTVSPDGIIVPAGELGGPLVILRDTGSKVDEVARRDDVQMAGVGALNASGTVWAVVRDEGRKLALTEFDAADGSTKTSVPMPGATGFSTGVAVSATGQLAVGTTGGSAYYFNVES
ncbi:PQQ-binding-like beta-propeller repeat protein [Gordonia zhaorongruii]|uniref:outer membrane protein assembly factor BamB family protein n=1 Tax=Gordonia zhaorongruii TaxID=2597659 RepID=UPI0011806F0B|nr:PQQ-binding-like beta-propeller repeat protein [Gordonia zhaorongruii]